jgi:hypothetical protein
MKMQGGQSDLSAEARLRAKADAMVQRLAPKGYAIALFGSKRLYDALRLEQRPQRTSRKSGYRFSEKDMRQRKNLERIPCGNHRSAFAVKAKAPGTPPIKPGDCRFE